MGHSLVLVPSLNLMAAWFQVRMCVAWALLRLLVALDAVVQSMPLTSAWQLRLLANRCWRCCLASACKSSSTCHQWLSEINLGFCHKGSFIPVPLIEAVGVPSPFFETGQRSSHRPFDVVPRVLLLPEQSLQLQPCPFNMW